MGSHRRQYVRRKVGERWKNECWWPSVKHGEGSVLVWCCISASGGGNIVLIDGIMNVEQDRQVLIHHAIPSEKHLQTQGNGFIFQHDHDPKHTANAVKSFLERKTANKPLTVMDWSQSPDLNIYRGSMGSSRPVVLKLFWMCKCGMIKFYLEVDCETITLASSNQGKYINIKNGYF